MDIYRFTALYKCSSYYYYYAGPNGIGSPLPTPPSPTLTTLLTHPLELEGDT